ncbi:VOC family protein [Jatrophihabitans sp. YIM 134969]
MASRLTLATEARDPDLLATFWAELLGRPAAAGSRGLVVPGSDTQVALRFVATRSPRSGPNRVHLHLTSDHATQDENVARALALGATPLDVGQQPGERHVVLADPEGNEFCVIERGNSFLAGCGLLGELACDGTRGVGLFWSAALEWPLVWDQDEETAVQSPAGGTKVAWGGPPVAPRREHDRHRFEITVPQQQLGPEVERLTGLGAARTGRTDADRVELTDPDGNEFELVLA